MALSKEAMIFGVVFILALIFLVILIYFSGGLIAGGLQSASPVPCPDWIGNLKYGIMKTLGNPKPSC